MKYKRTILYLPATEMTVANHGGNFAEIDLRTSYTSSGLSLLKQFYIPCLGAAVSYDRAAGYFRSTLYALTGLAMSDFAQRGGTCRIICSPRLVRDDIDAIERGYDWRERIDKTFQQELDDILQEPRNVPVIEFFSTLIATGTVEVRLAYKPDRPGQFHDKLGVFTDRSDNSISFVGSINETFRGWALSGNHENFEVFTDWRYERERGRVERHKKYFEELWQDERRGLRVTNIPQGASSQLEEYICDDGIAKAAEAVREVIAAQNGGEGGKNVGKGNGRSLYQHQEEAVREWDEAGNRGIIKHATGAGKTVTALEIVKRWAKKGRPAVVIVPSLVLVDQWIDEAKIHVPEMSVLRISGESRDRGWEDRVADFTRDMEGLGGRLTVGTIQSARTKKFLDRVQDGSHLLLVVDEVHRAGSTENRKVFNIDAGGRLGLSATPERYGDPEGTNAIINYFGLVLDCEYSLREAVEDGRLVPYDYHIQEVGLTSEEQAEWEKFTERIAKVFRQLPECGEGKKQFSDYFKQLLINRSKILKQAAGKVELCRRILSEEYREGERWLVYCDSQDQLGQVTEALRQEGLPTYTYHSNMAGSREATMRYFRERPCILVAIRCLDEGVDVPAASSAVILASSSNPREYIQRRGRVLRRDEGKYSASIHDALVLPEAGNGVMGEEAILGTEVGRAAVFAELARNETPKAKIQEIGRRFDVDVRQLTDEKLAYESGSST